MPHQGPVPPSYRPEGLGGTHPIGALSGPFYSVEGSGNNVANPNWGQAGTDYIRVAPAAYSDGVSTPAGADLPGARAISNALSDQDGQTTTSDRLMSAMVYAWGQFIDHDMDLTNTGKTESHPMRRGPPGCNRCQPGIPRSTPMGAGQKPFR